MAATARRGRQGTCEGFGPSFRRWVQMGSFGFMARTVRPIRHTAQGSSGDILGSGGLMASLAGSGMVPYRLEHEPE